MTIKNKKTTRTHVISAALIFAITAVASAQKQDSASARKDASVYAELTKAPAKASARVNPLAGDHDAVPAGRKLFDMHCAECHGDAARGTHRAPDLLAQPVRQATPGTLFWVLTNGVVRHGMPVWSKLPEPQRWQIVSYLKSLTISETLSPQ